MNKVVVIICALLISACAQMTYDPSKPIKNDEGLVVAKIYMSGSVGSAQIITRNKNRILDNYSFVMKQKETLFVFPMPVGTHTLDQILYGQGSQLVDVDLDCLGEFKIEPNKVNYIGDIYFSADPMDNYIVFSAHNSSFKVQDNYEAIIKEVNNKYDSIKTRFESVNTVVGPSTCKQEG